MVTSIHWAHQDSNLEPRDYESGSRAILYGARTTVRPHVYRDFLTLSSVRRRVRTTLFLEGLWRDDGGTERALPFADHGHGQTRESRHRAGDRRELEFPYV